MRGRHFPRLCLSCDAPLARKDDACWRCHAEWADDAEAATAGARVVMAAPSLQPDGRVRTPAVSTPGRQHAASTMGVK